MIKQLLKMTFRDEEKSNYYNKLRHYIFKNIKAEFFRFFLLNKKISSINLFEQRFHSQNGEDGIFRILFDKLKTTNRFCVEFGIHPLEGNTIYLKKQHWDCLWMDGNGDGVIIKKEIITAENINELFKKYDVPREFDLLSIDIDSNEYWLWKAIEGYSPRVVAIEYNASIPPTESKTVRYEPYAQWDLTNYFGASLLALQKLGHTKGYTLIGCDRAGVNAFFVRNDLVGDHFRIDRIENIFRPPGYGKKVNGMHVGHPQSPREMISV